jgi:hypothetical protein
MKKFIWLVIILVIIWGGYVFYKNGDSINEKNFTSVDQLTTSDKEQIAQAIVKGENIIRSGDTNAIKNLIKKTKPNLNVDQLPDQALISLGQMSSQSEPITKEDILDSTNWSVSQNKVSIIVKKGKISSLMRATYINGEWFRD